MSKIGSIATGLFALFVAGFLLATPATTQAAEPGQVLAADLDGWINVQRESGETWTIVFHGRMVSRSAGNQNIIELVGAGVVEGTTIGVELAYSGAGPAQREGSQTVFETSGQFTFVLAGSEQEAIVIDVISAGFLAKQGQRVGLGMHSLGREPGSGEQIVIDVISAGVVAR